MLSPIYSDMPTPWAIGFQDVGSPTFYGLIELHDHILFSLVIILVVVTWLPFLSTT